MSLRPSAPPPAEPLVLYGYEASPFCKLVRERLNDMELPHEYRSCARGSPKREEIFQAQGSFQAPFLLDPNRGICMFESTDILAHLAEHYGAEEGDPPERGGEDRADRQRRRPKLCRERRGSVRGRRSRPTTLRRRASGPL